ncbi:glycosyltransferase [Micromonospora phytophila]|uniref:glycosyltransferase family 2 protein n=1 Tax=Micromonospora phytophila TaxID=709888 RepID=UPI00202EC9CD|nr:glycosyltransferase [Micromonospora phytophila]MCM0675203.1 glycosyltransferase [Micromonospora phytophila]
MTDPPPPGHAPPHQGREARTLLARELPAAPDIDAPTVALMAPVRRVVPAISVCIAVRDRPDLLVKSIRSVLSGTFTDFEVVVVDDGSTVPAQECLAESGLLADERIRLVRRKPAGISAARNTALRVARGRYVTVLDSDDELADEGLARIQEFLTTTRARWIYTDYEEFAGGAARTIRLPSYPSARRMLWSVMTRPRLPFKHSGMSIDRELLLELGGYDEQLPIKVDVELVLRALANGIRPTHLGYPVVRFHRHSGSISRQRFAGLVVWFRLIGRYTRPRIPGLALGVKAVRAASEIGKWLVSSLGR